LDLGIWKSNSRGEKGKGKGEKEEEEEEEEEVGVFKADAANEEDSARNRATLV